MVGIGLLGQSYSFLAVFCWDSLNDGSLRCGMFVKLEEVGFRIRHGSYGYS